MSHRADDIIEQVANLLRAALTDGTHVFTHRRLSLAADQDELPAVSVDFGALGVDLQDPDEDYYDCTLTLPITSVAVEYDEKDLRQLLLSLARSIQSTLNATPLFSLDYVFDTNFAGWDEPEIDVSGDVLVGALTCTWQVMFRMHFDDPGATGSIPNL